MRIVNPHFIAPAPDANAPHVKHKDAVLGALTAMTDKQMVSFEDVRAALTLDDKALPDGAIHQIALDAGMKVMPE